MNAEIKGFGLEQIGPNVQEALAILAAGSAVEFRVEEVGVTADTLGSTTNYGDDPNSSFKD